MYLYIYIYIYIISSHSSTVFLNNFYGMNINKENELAKMMFATLSNRVLSAWLHLFFSAFDRYNSRRCRCAWTQLNKFSSWPQFWIEKSQNIFKKCLKACWTTFSLKVLSTLNFLPYFFSLKMKHENFASRNCYNNNYSQIENFVMLNITIWSCRVVLVFHNTI